MTKVSETRNKYAASKIRAAALPLILTTKTNRSDQIPKEIAELPLFTTQGSEIAIWAVGNSGDKLPGLAFVTGSGFGHWGIVVCVDENDQSTAKTLNGKIIPWEHGVFFFKER